jgi:FkbM family methyltransferase
MSILIDIGANHGQYTDAQLNNFSSILLVEANPFLCQQLEEKYRNNPKISIINAIASNKQEETFYISNADQISTADPEWILQSRFSKDYQWRPIQGIQTISLDSLVQQFPTLQRVKIDVEGYEWNVIQSLHTKVPELCFEWAEEKKEDILKTLTYLHELGFEKFHIQYQDEYSYRVPDNSWMPFESVYTTMSNVCIPTRKDYWGMIWAS